jgi:hypothetical protein
VSGEPLLSRRRLRGLALTALLCAALVAGQRWLPTDGWGPAVRWVIGAALTVGVIVWLGGLLIATVREFRRGLTDGD